MIIRDALQTAQRLDHSDSPRIDVELLLAEVLGKPRTFLYTWPNHILSDSEQAKFEQILQRRAFGEPMAHILKRREFWSLSLEVDSSTLIPRPDTEVVVERVLGLIAQGQAWAGRILDLGTGSGAIALALAGELPKAHLVGVDFSSDAVALAQRNAQQLRCNNAEFSVSDWFQRVNGRFDVIVSNPPYLDAHDEHLHSGDLRFEPRTALVASDQGLADLKLIIAQAPPFLIPGGWLLLEHGALQARAVREALECNGFTLVVTHQDYSGHDRVSGGQWFD